MFSLVFFSIVFCPLSTKSSPYPNLHTYAYINSSLGWFSDWRWGHELDAPRCDAVWLSTKGHKSVAARFHFFLQAPQWPCVVRKRFSRDGCCRGRSKPGCWIVGSSTREKLTTRADFQFSFHWLLMSTRIRSCHKGSWMEDRNEEGWWYQNELANCHEL